MKLISNLAHNLLNIPGWHTNRKIVVIESDDWGVCVCLQERCMKSSFDKMLG